MFTLTSKLSGEAKNIGILFGQLIFQICHGNPDISEVKAILQKLQIDEKIIHEIIEKCCDEKSLNVPLCFLAGGETTVEVKGSGKGNCVFCFKKSSCTPRVICPIRF